MFDLTGKVAVVTGGNGGIGLGIAEGMASCGANVVIAGRNAEKGAAALDTLRIYNAEAHFVSTDVTNMADCIGLIAQAEALFGGSISW